MPRQHLHRCQLRHSEMGMLPSCTSSHSSLTAEQFKIDQSGLINGTIGDGFWGDGLMIAQNSSWTTTIPKTVPSGNYLIRFETIALHSLPAVCTHVFVPSGCDADACCGVAILPRVRADQHRRRRQSAAHCCRACDVPWCLQRNWYAPSQSALRFLLMTLRVQTPAVSSPPSESSPASSADTRAVNCDLYTNEALTESTYVIPGPPLYGSSGSTTAAPAPPIVRPWLPQCTRIEG